MSQHGEAAEQIVNMATNVTVKGVECLTNLAGRGALSLATFLIAALKDEKRTSGKARMRAFNGKPTKVFAIKAKDLKLFAEEAKKYGVLYAAVINKKQPVPYVFFTLPFSKHACPNKAACWSPATPLIGIFASNSSAVVYPKIPLDGITFGSIDFGIFNSSSNSSSHFKSLIL